MSESSDLRRRLLRSSFSTLSVETQRRTTGQHKHNQVKDRSLGQEDTFPATKPQSWPKARKSHRITSQVIYPPSSFRSKPSYTNKLPKPHHPNTSPQPRLQKHHRRRPPKLPPLPPQRLAKQLPHGRQARPRLHGRRHQRRDLRPRLQIRLRGHQIPHRRRRRRLLCPQRRLYLLDLGCGKGACV